ncbi:MAG: rhodanese-like domain-containing protein [Candidatus Omnitrophota bacterium]
MVKKITREQLFDMLKEAKLKLVDVLDREHFQKEHIKGAMSLPINEIENSADKLLDKNDLIVVYCANFQCQASTKAAEKLISLGFKNVLDYKGGLEEYKAADLPLEGTLHETVQENIKSPCEQCCDIC